MRGGHAGWPRGCGPDSCPSPPPNGPLMEGYLVVDVMPLPHMLVGSSCRDRLHRALTASIHREPRFPTRRRPSKVQAVQMVVRICIGWYELQPGCGRREGQNAFFHGGTQLRPCGVVGLVARGCDSVLSGDLGRPGRVWV